MAHIGDFDVLVIGAGFSGITAIHRLRQTGLTFKCLEGTAGIGGTWYRQRYPGARVDHPIPFYQLAIPEVYNTWTWSEKYPGQPELLKYFQHVDETLNLSKDIVYNAHVNGTVWNAEASRWTVSTAEAHSATAKYVLLATGTFSESYTPPFENASTFKGQTIHTAHWPENLSLAGKRVALIGNAATGVQLTQEVGKQAEHLDVLVRRPGFTIPMRQRKFGDAEYDELKEYLPGIMERRQKNAGGTLAVNEPGTTFEADEKHRKAVFERVYRYGGFNFIATTFVDYLYDPKANRALYDFWAEKTRSRMKDAKKRDIMVPLEPVVPIMARRPVLEQDYYEVLDQSNVDIHPIAKNPIKGFHEGGLVLVDGTKINADVIILATGYYAGTGPLYKVGIRDKDGKSLEEKWQDQISSYLGLTIPGCPNLFITYSVHSPAAYTNGAATTDIQMSIVIDMLQKLQEQSVKTIEPNQSSADEWQASLDAAMAPLLISSVDSWWTGTNIEGGKRQILTYIAGNDVYDKQCREAVDGWKGFEITQEA